MIVKVTNPEGQSAFVDNDGQENGQVRIFGDAPLSPHLDSLLNKHLTLQFKTQADVIDEDLLLFTRPGFPNEIYKASDFYIREQFIPAICPMFEYTAEIIKE